MRDGIASDEAVADALYGREKWMRNINNMRVTTGRCVAAIDSSPYHANN